DVWHQTSNLLAAFQAAFNGLTDEHDRLRGSGIVLWSANSLVGSKCEKARPRSFPVLNPDHIVDSRQVLSVEVRQCDKLNYSMLHNNRPLFKTFRIKRQGRERGVAQGVRVEVVLHAGTEKSTYSAAFDLTEWTPVVDVNSKARVSLTSELGRSLQESVFS